MKKINLKSKLIFSFLITGLIPMLTIEIYSNLKNTSAIEKEAMSKLKAVRNIKGSAVKQYFKNIKNQLLTFSHDVSIQDAMVLFSSTYRKFSTENQISNENIASYKKNLDYYYQNQFAKKYQEKNGNLIQTESLINQLDNNALALQYYYIGTNPNSLGNKETLDAASDRSNYTKTHAKYHPSIREFLHKFEYNDIFLVDIETGNIVYSVFKELDYATSLLDGPYSNTNFAEAFKKARDINDKSSFAIVDYQQYSPSYGSPASFIAAPIWKDNKKLGVAVFKMPIEGLNKIMGDRAGMGDSGETYLVGPDRRMRSDSYLSKKKLNVITSFKNIEEGKIKSLAVEAVLKGEQGDKTLNNYLNKEVLSSYEPIDVLGLKWGLIAEKSTKEALKSVYEIRNFIYILLSVCALIIGLFAFYLSSSLSQTIQNIAYELFENAKKVNHSSDNISTSSHELSEAATKAASSLQETVSSIDEISSMIQRNADAAASSTKVSAKSSDAASRGKKTVELMINSINEISGSNDQIAAEMQRNNTDISKIVQVISEIGEKTKVINDIVFQTKLLSFNASVEAARAGEHGKGFAVVAEEVGNLASMSGKAALEITEMLDSSIKQVTEIVDNTKTKVEVLINTSKEKVETGTKTANECGEALDEILQNVTSVNEMVREIASASAEQSTGVQEVTKAMQQLDQTTHQNTSVAQQTSVMATQLKGQANGLNSSVQQLMTVITGSGDQHNFEKNKKSQTENCKNEEIDNVLVIPSKEEKNNEVSIGLKVSGLDTVIPNETDERFEDL